MRRTVHHRLARLRAQLPEGCKICREWPHVRLLVEGDPEPPSTCGACGRVFTGLTRVYVLGIDRADI